MGQPLPGFSCAVLHDDRDEPTAAGTPGRIAADMTASPLAHFAGYHGDPDITGRFTPDGRWWLTGDGGFADADENYFFSARDDDVIIMAAYRIGPFEVESVLVTHDRVIEAAAIGVPDELRGEVIEAFVVLRDSSPGDPSGAPKNSPVSSSNSSRTSSPRTPTRAACTLLTRCRKHRAARSSDTSCASSGPKRPCRNGRSRPTGPLRRCRPGGEVFGVMSAERAGLVRYPAGFLPGAGMTDVLAGSGGQPGPLPGDDRGGPGLRPGHAWRRATGGSSHGWRSGHHGPR